MSMRRVLVVNTADRGGGAERVAMNILDGFTRLGTDTWLAVAEKRTDHPRVVPVHATAPPGAATRARRRIVEMRRRIDRRLGLEDLAHWSTRDLLVFLIRNLRSERVLLVATYRTDELYRGHPLRSFFAELERIRRLDRRDWTRP